MPDHNHITGGGFRFDGTGMQPGDDLFTVLDVTTWVQGTLAFGEYTGIPAELTLRDPLVATALPLYPPDPTTPPGWRRLISTDALWHPLMWLPDLLRPRVTETGDLEPAKVWALRVAFEMQYSGLYHPDRGWYDILTDQQIDPDPDRLRRWLAGWEDPQLDQISITPYLAGTDRQWAREMADGLVLVAQSRTWALIADELAQLCDLAIDDADTAQLLPLMVTPILDADDAAPDLWAGWEARIGEADPTAVGEARDWLQQIRDTHWEGVEALAGFTPEETA